MSELTGPAPFIYMAPLKGITDSLFRRVFTTHFNGIDAAIAPFINPQTKATPSDKLLIDILPENNCGLPLIPQVINNNGDDFISLANRLYDLGYKEINWNLGCPVPMIAKKRRGSGLLPFPDVIEELLNTDFAATENKALHQNETGISRPSGIPYPSAAPGAISTL